MLKTWNKEVFEDLLGMLWIMFEHYRWKKWALGVEANESFKKWSLLEKLSWRQKSREVWLEEGDRNTRFFHKMVNAHKNNQLGKIRINGDWFIEG